MGRIDSGSFLPEFPEEDALTSAQYDALQAQAATQRAAAVPSKDREPKGDIPDRSEFIGALIGESWMGRAACRGTNPNLFFAPPHNERKDDKEAREAAAKAICKQCLVRSECLEAALSVREQHGIWGGLNEQERRQIQDRRRRSA